MCPILPADPYYLHLLYMKRQASVQEYFVCEKEGVGGSGEGERWRPKPSSRDSGSPLSDTFKNILLLWLFLGISPTTTGFRMLQMKLTWVLMEGVLDLPPPALHVSIWKCSHPMSQFTWDMIWKSECLSFLSKRVNEWETAELYGK